VPIEMIAQTVSNFLLKLFKMGFVGHAIKLNPNINLLHRIHDQRRTNIT
jgi:DNA-binding TFAR19-related protein (PDSD5 family)